MGNPSQRIYNLGREHTFLKLKEMGTYFCLFIIVSGLIFWNPVDSTFQWRNCHPHMPLWLVSIHCPYLFSSSYIHYQLPFWNSQFPYNIFWRQPSTLPALPILYSQYTCSLRPPISQPCLFNAFSIFTVSVLPMQPRHLAVTSVIFLLAYSIFLFPYSSQTLLF